MKHFDGPKEGDEDARVVRLTGQLRDVYEAIEDGYPHTLRDIELITGHPQASISAQLRNLRKKRFGGYTIKKEHIGDGLYVYWLES